MSSQSNRQFPKSRFQVTRPHTEAVKRFRLLTIGKTGCGKTTILSKVCGESKADKPGTTRGAHDIEKEIEFEDNDKLVAHDSQGFEAGTVNEFDVVKAFIHRRSETKDINKQLHMIWYCVEMNSRPIQQAERKFFSVPCPVPVLVIVTKFDNFVEDILQELEEATEKRSIMKSNHFVLREREDKPAEVSPMKFNSSIEDVLQGLRDKATEEGAVVEEQEEELERGLQEAKNRFHEHFYEPLMALPHPPKDVLPLCDVHRSTRRDNRLRTLIRKTMDALSPKKEVLLTEVEILFGSAQIGSASAKVEIACRIGVERNYFLSGWVPEPPDRGQIFGVWRIYEPASLFFISLLSKYSNDSRQIGHPKSSCYREVRRWNNRILTRCKYIQEVADIIFLMDKVFLHAIQGSDKVERLFQWYFWHSNSCEWLGNAILAAHRSLQAQSLEPGAARAVAPRQLLNIFASIPPETLSL